MNRRSFSRNILKAAIKVSSHISLLLSINREKFWYTFKEFCDDNGSWTRDYPRTILLHTLISVIRVSGQPRTSPYNDMYITSVDCQRGEGERGDCSDTLHIRDVPRRTEAVHNFRPRGGCHSSTNRRTGTRVESVAGKLLICPKVQRAGARNARGHRGCWRGKRDQISSLR